jgi:hypothetical protein
MVLEGGFLHEPEVMRETADVVGGSGTVSQQMLADSQLPEADVTQRTLAKQISS